MSILPHLNWWSRAADPSANAVAVRIQQLLPHVHSGTLRFWGAWFGKPHDNFHTIVRANADGDCLILHFNEEETLLKQKQKADKQVEDIRKQYAELHDEAVKRLGHEPGWWLPIE